VTLLRGVSNELCESWAFWNEVHKFSPARAYVLLFSSYSRVYVYLHVHPYVDHSFQGCCCCCCCLVLSCHHEHLAFVSDLFLHFYFMDVISLKCARLLWNSLLGSPWIAVRSWWGFHFIPHCKHWFNHSIIQSLSVRISYMCMHVCMYVCGRGCLSFLLQSCGLPLFHSATTESYGYIRMAMVHSDAVSKEQPQLTPDVFKEILGHLPDFGVVEQMRLLRVCCPSHPIPSHPIPSHPIYACVVSHPIPSHPIYACVVCVVCVCSLPFLCAFILSVVLNGQRILAHA
jgi:hypothetical protein